MFDLFIDLLTGGSDGPGRFEIQVLVPVTTAAGGSLELAEIPGFGPLLPGTAREVMDMAEAFRRIAVDSLTGEVVTVDDAVPTGRNHEKVRPEGPATIASTDKLAVQLAEGTADKPVQPGMRPTDLARHRPGAERVPEALARMSAAPLVVRALDSPHYRPSGRLTRHLEARDRTCQVPGCHRRAGSTDKDHRIPWPCGATTLASMACLCRRHHRAKHTSFVLTRDADGVFWWRTRGGQWFRRRPDPR